MRKSLLIITSCIGILSANAQITITSADVPVPTTIIYQATDTVPGISVGIADTNQTWNITALSIHTLDTTTALPYASVPNSAFSSANLVMQQGSTGFYGYAINSSTSLTVLGGGGMVNIQGQQRQVNQINTPNEIAFQFPASYDSSFTNNYSTNAKFYFGHTITPPGIMVDSIHRKSRVQKTFLVDAWGTITTPLGGPYNVLRIKETKISHDTIAAYVIGSWNDVRSFADSTTTYSWWANGFGVPLATATMDSTGAVSMVQWLTSIPATVSATNVTCEGLCNGTATTANPTWGTPPYTYSWNTNPVQDTSTATGLCVGSYSVTVTDAFQAIATGMITVNAPLQPTITANGNALSTSFSATGFQWYFNGVVITNAITSNYTVTQNGSYTVVVSNGSCNDTSAPHVFNIIGINETPLTNGISIYPNPASNQIAIQFDASMTSNKQDVLIEISNELGQRVKKVGGSMNKNEMIIDVADLPHGIYFIRVQNQNNSINKKFIKQ